MSRIIIDVIMPILDVLLIRHISLNAAKNRRMNPGERRVEKRGI
jgi:hypothetical protein